METKGQGAIEYLLLIAAAIVVVAVVISFIISTIQPVKDSGTTQTYDYICKQLDTNSLTCGCYECDVAKGEIIGGSYKSPNKTNCDALAIEKDQPALKGTGRCPAGFP
jgi:hypothetical protein